MIKKWFVFIVAAMLAGTAFAAEMESSDVTPNLDKGTKVLEGAGYINVMGDEVQIQLAYGRLVADGIEVALVAGLRDNDFYMTTTTAAAGPVKYTATLEFALLASCGLAEVTSACQSSPQSAMIVLRWLALKLKASR